MAGSTPSAGSASAVAPPSTSTSTPSPSTATTPWCEKHYVSKRSRRQKGLLAFLAQDAETRVFCYANAEVRKEDQNDEILRFVEFWKQRTGRLPEELIFDSKLTTYANLSQLNQRGIDFITLRRRTPKLLAEIYATPASAWRRIELESVARTYRTPRILDAADRAAGLQGPHPAAHHHGPRPRGAHPAADQPTRSRRRRR